MAQTDSESKEIDGCRYEVFMLDPLVANGIAIDLAHIFAPGIGAIAKVVSGKKEGLSDTEAKSDDIDETIEKALKELIQNITRDKQEELLKILAKKTKVHMPDGKSPFLDNVFNDHFRGKLSTMYKWEAFALKSNFKDFFSAGNPISLVAQKLQEAAL